MNLSQRALAVIETLSEREVSFLRMGVVLVPVLLLYLLLLSPLLAERERAMQDYSDRLADARDALAVTSVDSTTVTCSPDSVVSDADTALAVIQAAATQTGVEIRLQTGHSRIVVDASAASADTMLLWARKVMCAGVDVSVLSVAAANAGAGVQGRLETAEPPR